MSFCANITIIRVIFVAADVAATAVVDYDNEQIIVVSYLFLLLHNHLLSY